VEDLRFVVVGAYVTDCLVSTTRMPAWGEEHEAKSVRTAPGGKALNQAVALARLGAQVAAVGVVGDDGVGRDILAALVRERIDVASVESRADVASAICVVFVGDDGENSIVWHIDDDVAVRPATVVAAAPAIEEADAVLLTFEMPAAAIWEAIVAARDLDALVLVQPAPPLADSDAVASLPWDAVDVLVPNEAEARALLAGTSDGGGLPAGDLAGALADGLGVPLVVVTLGEAGCVVHAAGETWQYPAQKVAAVDTTGAGDAFAATLAASLVAGVPVPEAVNAAQSAAARAVQHSGGHEAMPSAR
jgi:ribokinase